MLFPLRLKKKKNVKSKKVYIGIEPMPSSSQRGENFLKREMTTGTNAQIII
jgi:hypothetical protein